LISLKLSGCPLGSQKDYTQVVIFAKLRGLLEKGAFRPTRKQLYKLRSTAKEREGLGLTAQAWFISVINWRSVIWEN
jgi:hypothetical protein